jgi:opacity protein-like surface antigen
MKKLLITTLLALASLSAVAGTATIEYSSIEGLNGGKDGTGYLFQVSETVAKNLDLSAQMLTTQSDGTHTLGSRVEVGITPKLPTAFGTLYTKVSVGEKLTSAGPKEYYAVEPGITVPVTDNISVRAGYRYRVAFDSAINDTTRTERLGASYALTKQDSLTVRFDRQRGDSQQNSWNFAYTRSF